ncbi:TraR/DksA family transcriptional regulator [Sneathiella aquimaris]|uniref:TraR/DksA family transcriptional regulator n=1 Tax=Sneathiella aquimaris TaxID=2599305 RepID=UPI00146EA69B|nr:TraR/DksA family transcriptional regulator [Sneathiella aquimaris]
MNVQEAKEKLLARKAELEDIMAASINDEKPVELDQSRVGRLSRMDALQNQAMAQDTVRRRKNEITRIDAALKRLADGDYGYCVTCDEEISEKRLSLDPSTPVCIECASV